MIQAIKDKAASISVLGWFKILIVTAAAFALFGILKKFHLIGGSSKADLIHEKTDEENAIAASELTKEDLFSETYFQSLLEKLYTLLKKKNATSLKAELKNQFPYSTKIYTNWVNTIYDAKGTFLDHEDKVFAMFDSMQSRYALSRMAHEFNNIKGRDLYGYLTTFMNDAQLARVEQIIKSKPEFINVKN